MEARCPRRSSISSLIFRVAGYAFTINIIPTLAVLQVPNIDLICPLHTLLICFPFNLLLLCRHLAQNPQDNSTCCHISSKQNIPTGSYLILLCYKLTYPAVAAAAAAAAIASLDGSRRSSSSASSLVLTSTASSFSCGREGVARIAATGTTGAAGRGDIARGAGDLLLTQESNGNNNRSPSCILHDKMSTTVATTNSNSNSFSQKNISSLLAVGRKPLEDDRIAIFSRTLNHDLTIDGIRLLERLQEVAHVEHLVCGANGGGALELFELNRRKENNWTWILEYEAWLLGQIILVFY
uniref:Uncharacterized protein n=1 Tax=Oryza meridionalis TaxID=40149 RepID=A0A0E0DKI9_9ORYZ